jgi:hypothetical protein
MTEYLTTADSLFFHQQLIERYGRARFEKGARMSP